MYNYIFFFKNITIGGAELLIEKISREMIRENDSATVLCEDIFDEMETRLVNSKVEIKRIREWESYKEIYNNLSEMKNPKCITFEWDIFLNVYHLKIKNKKTIFYAIDYEILAFGHHRKNSRFKTIERNITQFCLLSMIKRKNVISMDEQTVRFTKKYINSKQLMDTEFKIIRIPVDVPKNTADSINKKYDSDIFEILSIARADFPFKGYLLGLVDFMEHTDDVTFLRIISYGDDIEILKERIESKQDHVRNRISLHGKTGYDELNCYFDRAKLYIGMGTTIIDAAVRGVISIPVVARTERLISTHFFHEDYKDVALDDSGVDNTEALFNKIKKISYQEYTKYSELSNNLVINNYGTEYVTIQIKEFSNTTLYDSFDWNIWKMYHFRKMTKVLKDRL